VVRAVQGALAAWNRHGGPSSPELPAVRFLATQRVGDEIGASVMLLESWRGCCTAPVGLGVWRSGVATAADRGEAAL